MVLLKLAREGTWACPAEPSGHRQARILHFRVNGTKVSRGLHMSLQDFGVLGGIYYCLLDAL